MNQKEMFYQAMLRPADYDQQTPAKQWAIDKQLGILDWDGSCPHEQGKLCWTCQKRYDRRGIKVVQARPRFETDLGDLLYGEAYVVSMPTVEELEGRKLFYCGIHFPNTCAWSGLMNAGVNVMDLRNSVIYECPWTGNKFYWMYPIGILLPDQLEDGKMYNEHDPWILADSIDEANPSDIMEGPIVRAMMGHGYTEGTLPCDGGGERKLAVVNLSNGHQLLVATHFWYNK